MIGRIEFLVAILIPLILEGVVIFFSRRYNRDKLPPGSYLIETPLNLIEEKASGTAWSRYGGLIGHWISDLSIFGLVMIYTLSYLSIG